MTPISLLLHLFLHPRICGLFASISRKLLQSLQYFLKCFRGVFLFFFLQAHGIQGVLQTLPAATESEGKVTLLFFSSVFFFFFFNCNCGRCLIRERE